MDKKMEITGSQEELKREAIEEYRFFVLWVRDEKNEIDLKQALQSLDRSRELSRIYQTVTGENIWDEVTRIAWGY